MEKYMLTKSEYIIDMYICYYYFMFVSMSNIWHVVKV